MASQTVDFLTNLLARFETLAKNSQTPPKPAIEPVPRTKKIFDWIRKQIPPIELVEHEGNVLIERESGIVFDRPKVSGTQLATGRISKAVLKKPPPTGRIQLVLNRFNNYEHSATGIVFDQTFAIGWQNPATGTIEDLSSAQLDYCKSRKIRYSLAKTYEKELAVRRTNAPLVEQDEENSDSEDEEEDPE